MSEEMVEGLDYIDLNLNEVDGSDGGFDVTPPGDYIFSVKKIVGGVSKNQNPKMTVHLTVVEALDEQNEKAVGNSAIASFVLKKDNEFGRRRLRHFVQSCGVELDNKGGFHAPDLIEREFVATVKHEEYTETDPITQKSVTRSSQRIFRERTVESLDDDKGKQKKAAPKKRKRSRANGSANGRAASDDVEEDDDGGEEEEERRPSRSRSRRRAAPSR
jgi:hypothetical protein